jgi:hypothetical protein
MGEREWEREKERERSGEVVRDTTFRVRKKNERMCISGFEISQAVPARPSGTKL